MPLVCDETVTNNIFSCAQSTCNSCCIMHVTLSDIGRELGISHQVVSKAINGGQSTAVVSKQLDARIRETAARLGYRPSSAGRSLRSGKTMSIGILVGPSEDFLLTSNTLISCVTALSDRGYSTTLFSAERGARRRITSNARCSVSGAWMLCWFPIPTSLRPHSMRRSPGCQCRSSRLKSNAASAEYALR